MNTTSLRLSVAGGNVLMVLLIVLVGYRAIRGGDDEPRLEPPADFKPLDYVIKNDVGEASPLQRYTPIWQELDRPKAAAPAPAPAGPAGPTTVSAPPPPPSAYSLVMVHVDEANPKRSSFIVRTRTNQQRTYGLDDDMDGYKVVEIKVEGAGDGRVGMVKLQRGSVEMVLELQRDATPK